MAPKLKKSAAPQFIDPDQKAKFSRAAIITTKSTFNEKSYEYSDRFQKSSDPSAIHTVSEMVEALKRPENDIEARCLAFSEKKKDPFYVRLNKDQFLESLKRNQNRKFRESFDAFGYDCDSSAWGSQLYGQETIPLLGGPFYKQLYYYDYIRMHNLAFYAYHHDPIARAIVHVIRDFVLGRGFRIDVEDKTELALWRAFEEVNDFDNFMDMLVLEMSIYGENMIWWLPDHQTKIQYQLRPGQEAPKGLIPRVRLMDPSVIWDIITYPEDITRVLAYQWVAPTQYQTYTKKDGGSQVPGSKFIYQQIPADQVQHHKINSVSNEKRGRSDLFPVLGYLKRLRDAVNYSLVSMQKQSAWSIDTSIDGAQEDIDAYVNDLNSQNAMPTAGSEFVHSKKVERTFLAATAGAKGQSEAFEWCLSMIAAGVGIPVSYFGTHLSGGQTRASAMIATEPVAKKFQMRQLMVERIIKSMARRLGIRSEVEVSFPELIVQDRSAKLKDLALAETQKWLSPRRAAEIAAKELHVTEFEYDAEQKEIAKAEPAGPSSPLTAPPSLTKDDLTQPVSGVTSQTRRSLADAERNGNA